METNIGIKINKKEREEIKRAAKSIGLNVSAFGRMLFLKEAKKINGGNPSV